MTYRINLTQNDIKRIIAEHIGNCKPENVLLQATTTDSPYGHETEVTASVTLSGPMTMNAVKEAYDV